VKHPSAPPAYDLTQGFLVPACAVTRVADGERFTAALVGPAEAQVGGAERQSVSLRSGRFIVRAQHQRVDVVAPDAHIRISASSFAEIEVRQFQPTRVAVYAGSASVEVAMTKSSLTVTAGRSWNGVDVGQTGLGDSDHATQILASPAAQIPLCPTTTGSTAAPPKVEATAAPPRRTGRTSDTRPIEPEPTPTATLAEESSTADAQRLAEAIRRLRADHDPRAALALLDALPQSSVTTFADEITLVRIEALLDLGDRAAALSALDSLPLPNVARGAELVVLRADLRAQAKRWHEAIADYGHGSVAASPQLVERSLFGRARCRMMVSDISGANADLHEYLRRFPAGQFAADARRMLGK
jgi:hypothetical protein